MPCRVRRQRHRIQRSPRCSSTGESWPTVPGIIQVTSNPSGAEIIFDDRQNSSWMTPYTFQNVSKGRHTLEVQEVRLRH